MIEDWLFGEEELKDIREWSSKRNQERVRNAIIMERKAQGRPEPIDLNDVEFIGAQEQLDLCRYFERTIPAYCDVFEFDTTIQATALAFFKRFYLFSSMMDYQPKNIVYGEEEIGKPTNPYSLTHSSTRLTCLFLAAKVENNFITLEDFLKKIKKGPPPAQVLVDLELEVSQGIRFEYVIHHPLWPLHGVFLDIQDYLKQSISSTSTHKEALKKLAHTYIKAKELVIISLRTDLQFLMWPSQIAIACLQAAAKEYEFMEDFNAYLIKRFEVGGDKVAAMMESKQMQQRQQDSSEPLDNLDGDEVFRRLRAQWDKAETIIKQAQSTTIDKALATSISDKLKTCQNPEFNPDSLISQRRREEALREKEEKRNKKIKMQAEIEAKSHTIFQ